MFTRTGCARKCVIVVEREVCSDGDTGRIQPSLSFRHSGDTVRGSHVPNLPALYSVPALLTSTRRALVRRKTASSDDLDPLDYMRSY